MAPREARRQPHPVLAAAAQGQHELEEDQAIDLHRASPDVAGITGGEQDSARDGSVKAAEDDLGSSNSEMSDIDVRSRQERESRGFYGECGRAFGLRSATGSLGLTSGDGSLESSPVRPGCYLSIYLSI